MRAPTVLVVFALLLPAGAAAQISAGGTPPSQRAELADRLADPAPTVTMPAVDVEALVDEDRSRDLEPGVPFRFGETMTVDLDLARDGLWEALPDGSRVGRLAIESPGALSINLAFERYRLPPGAELYVVGEGDFIGAFTDRNNKEDGRLATTLVAGDTVVLEYREPAAAAFAGEVRVARVTHGYRSVKSAEGFAVNESGSCQNNVHCPPLTTGWDDPVRSVAKYVMGGGLCTGALINNTAHDGTPYFLTADHCYSNPSWWVFWFNYEADGCSNPSWDPAYDSLSSASYRASNSSSDFALVELSTQPPDSYEVYYAGWNRSSSAPSSAVGIHHPAGDIKKFSVESSQVWASGSMWEVGPWDDGTTEGGSSGSPLFGPDKRIVGQLYGGSSACWGGSENGGTDIYGRLDLSWNGSSSSSRLSDWLDPLGTGATAIDGHDPNAPAAPDDAAVTIVEPSDGAVVCSGAVEVVAQLTNAGSETLSSADLEWRVDGGAWSTEAWSGSLGPGSSTEVVLGDVSVGGGGHEVEVVVDAPGDSNPSNDSASADFDVVSGGESLPLSQGFQSGSFPPGGWSVSNPDGNEAWTRTTQAGGFGGSSASAFFDNFEDDFRGTADWLVSPPVDLGSVDDPVLEFAVAYARYDAEYTDSMEVRVSEDCGASWSTAWTRSGTSLATASDHSQAFVPTSGEWRTESVDLSDWGDATVQIAFVDITGYGNNLYVDDVVVDGVAVAGDDDDAGSGDDDDAVQGDDDDDAGPSGDDDDAVSGDDDDAVGLEDETGDGSNSIQSEGDGKAQYIDELQPYCGCSVRGVDAPGAVVLVGVMGLLARRRRWV